MAKPPARKPSKKPYSIVALILKGLFYVTLPLFTVFGVLPSESAWFAKLFWIGISAIALVTGIRSKVYPHLIFSFRSHLWGEITGDEDEDETPKDKSATTKSVSNARHAESAEEIGTDIGLTGETLKTFVERYMARDYAWEEYKAWCSTALSPKQASELLEWLREENELLEGIAKQPSTGRRKAGSASKPADSTSAAPPVRPSGPVQVTVRQPQSSPTDYTRLPERPRRYEPTPAPAAESSTTQIPAPQIPDENPIASSEPKDSAPQAARRPINPQRAHSERTTGSPLPQRVPRERLFNGHIPSGETPGDHHATPAGETSIELPHEVPPPPPQQPVQSEDLTTQIPAPQIPDENPIASSEPKDSAPTTSDAPASTADEAVPEENTSAETGSPWFVPKRLPEPSEADPNSND